MRSFRLVTATVVLLSALVALAESTDEIIARYSAAEEIAAKVEALIALGRQKERKAVNFLLKVFRNEKETGLRCQAVYSLGAMGTADAAEALASVAWGFEDAELAPAFRYAYAEAAKAGRLWTLIDGVHRNRRGRTSAAKVHLLSLLPLDGALVKRGIKAAVRWTKDRDAEVRYRAALYLSEFSEPEALAAIGKMVRDSDLRSAMLAIRVLRDREIGDVMDHLIEALDSKHPEVIAAAIDAACRGSDSRLARKLPDLVDHPDSRVRDAAIAGILDQRDRSAVEALIKRVRTAGGRRRAFIIEALKEVTGEDMAEPAEWWKWWRENEKEFAFPPPRTTSRGPTFFGTAVSSRRVIFIIDVSSSMAQAYKKKNRSKLPERTTSPGEKNGKTTEKTVTKIEMAKKELISAVRRLTFDTRFNIIFYNQNYHPWHKSIQKASVRLKDEAIAFVQTFRPNGMTNIYDTLVFALKDTEADTIYLLSDGLPTAGTIRDPEKILSEIAKLNRGRVTINTIGFGLKKRGRRLLERLAKQNHGVFLDR